MLEQNEVLTAKIVEGMKAGGRAAIRRARHTHTKLVIWRDEKIVEITPDEAEEMMRKASDL